MDLETTTPKKPILIYRQEETIKRFREQGQFAAEQINHFLNMAQTEMNLKFTKDEAEKLASDPEAYLLDWARQQYEFPKADDEFNQKALGMDINSILSFYHENSKYWKNIKLEFSEGSFRFNEDKLVERYSFYARTDQQKEAWEYANKLSKTLNEGIKKGLIKGLTANRLDRSIMFIKVSRDEKDQIRVSPDGRKIAKSDRYQ